MPDSGTPVDARESRTGTALWGIWLVAVAILAALVAAVTHYLRLPPTTFGTGGHAMSGSRMDAALTRLGPPGGTRQLLGRSLLTAWQLDAVAIAAVVLAAGWYLGCVVRLRRSGSWSAVRTGSFLAGLAVCVLATCASIGVYDMALFSAHMIGHLAFVMVAPTLLMAGRPLDLALQSGSARSRRRLRTILDGRILTLLSAPPVAMASYAAVIVGSHLTGLMDVIMRNSWAGQLEHLVYLVIGCQFFLLVLGDPPVRWQLSTPARWFMLALSMAVDTFVGLVIMQANRPVYLTPLAGLNVHPISDTHTGGAIMWFGGDAIMAAVMIALVLNWLGDPVRQRQDGHGWLEQARRATFVARVGSDAAADDDLDFDTEDDRLASYNAWLASVHSSAPGSTPDRN